MTLSDALLNTKKYIKEPKYHQKEKMWGYEVYKNDRWTEFLFLTEYDAWTAFYVEFRSIKEKLLADEKIR